MSKKTLSARVLLLAAAIFTGAFAPPSADGRKSESAGTPASLHAPKPKAAPVRIAQGVDRKRIEKIVREYLIENPEVLVEAMQALEARREAEREAAAQSSIRKNRRRIYADSEDPVGGNPEGDVTIVEFFDYRCGFCKRAAPAVEEALAKDKGIRIVYKEFPILGPNSVLAARAALASRAQGRYLAFHRALMAARISYDEKSVLKLAASLGLDTARLKQDMRSPRIQAIIERNRALARSLGIRGTPAFIVGERIFPGALTPRQLARMIEQARGERAERR